MKDAAQIIAEHWTLFWSTYSGRLQQEDDSAEAARVEAAMAELFYASVLGQAKSGDGDLSAVLEAVARFFQVDGKKRGDLGHFCRLAEGVAVGTALALAAEKDTTKGET